MKRKKFTIFLTALLMLIWGGEIWGQTRTTISWTASEQGYSNGQEISSVTFDSYVSGSFDKGTNNNAPKYYTTGTAIRCYGGNYFTITTTSGNITSIVITFGSGDGSNEITTDVGTYNGDTWSGSSESVKFTIGGTSGNRRIAGLAITYTTSGGITTYTVTYDANGGEGTVTDANSPYEADATVTVLKNSFTYGCHTFSNWNTAADGSGTNYNPDETFTISANTTLYAQWTQDTYTITYNANGGTGTMEDGAKNCGEDYTIAKNGFTPQDGYAFVAWNTQSDGSGTAYAAGSTYSTDADLALYAQWSNVSYTVTFNPGSGTCGTISLIEASVGAGVSLPDASPSSACISNGWTFAGWKETSACTETTVAPTLYTAGDIYYPTTDCILYAVYMKEEGGSVFSRYEKVTSAPDDWSGKYLLSTGTYTATGEYSSNHLSIANFEPGTTENTKYEFTLTKVGTTGYSILFPDGNYYLGYGTSGTNFAQSTTKPTSSTTAYLWTPGANDYTANVGTPARKIAANGITDFRPYSNPSSSTYAIVYLYKRIEGGTTTYNSNPSCEEPTQVATPTFSPNGGNFYQTQEIALSCSTDGATIYYTLDGNDPTTESTVYSEPFTINETTTVKAFAVKDGLTNSSIATATFTKITPMTVAEAIAALNESSPIDNAYVSGIISQVDSYNSSYNSITYWISDDGTTANQLEVYSGKGLNNTDFSSVNDLQVNDQVVVTGQLKKYNEIYEFNYNNYLVYFNRPVVPNIMVEPNEVNATYEQTEGTLTITLQNTTAIGIEDFGIKFYDEEGNELIGGDIPGWINFDNVSFLEGVYSVCYHIGENNSTQRTAYVKVYTIAEEVYSNTITIMQNAAPQSVMYQYSINGTEGEITEVLEGTIITLGTTDDIDEFTFAGWTTNPNNVNDILAANSSFTLNDTYVFYAVYATPTSYSFTITKDVFNGTSYAANNNEKTSTATSATGATMQVRWTSYQVMLDNNVMQWQKKNGYIYNSTNLGSITNVTVTSSEGTFTTFIGSTENPTENVGNGGYFKTSVGDKVGKTSALTVTFTAPTYYTRVFSLNETADSDVTISGPTVIQNGSTLNMGNYQLTNTNPANLVIEDGGQLIINNAGVQATVMKNFLEHGTYNKGEVPGWYFISSPVKDQAIQDFVDNATDGDYDLYKWVGSNKDEDVYKPWYNYKQHDDPNDFGSSFQTGIGYLAGYESSDEFPFKGELNYGDAYDFTPNLTYNGNIWECYALLGNPYSYALDWTDFQKSDVYDGFAIVNPAIGSYFYYSGTGIINPSQGFFVKTTGDDNLELRYNKGSHQRTQIDQIDVVVSSQNGIDNAIIRLEDESKGGFTKLDNFNSENPMLWLPVNDKEYAIASYSEGTVMVPVNFKAGTTAKYTIRMKATGQYSYLHLIDRLTGDDIDMLIEGEYSFIGSPRDNAERFIVKFNNNSNSDTPENDIFAYQNGDELFVTGNGTIQVFDVTGRFVQSKEVHGNTSMSISSLPKGVYIFRLIGSEIKTQKIVVR